MRQGAVVVLLLPHVHWLLIMRPDHRKPCGLNAADLREIKFMDCQVRSFVIVQKSGEKAGISATWNICMYSKSCVVWKTWKNYLLIAHGWFLSPISRIPQNLYVFNQYHPLPPPKKDNTLVIPLHATVVGRISSINRISRQIAEGETVWNCYLRLRVRSW